MKKTIPDKGMEELLIRIRNVLHGDPYISTVYNDLLTILDEWYVYRKVRNVEDDS